MYATSYVCDVSTCWKQHACVACRLLPARTSILPWCILTAISVSRSIRLSTYPTGSNTAALIYLLHTLTEFVPTYDYVHVIAHDFSKAFDSVRHHSLVSKLANFTLPDYLHNWMVNNLSGRQHQTKLDGSVSSILPINASIIQGSALGPLEYVLTASGLHPTSSNLLCKYADDSWFLHPIRRLYHKRSNA